MENAPVILLAGYNLNPEIEGKYLNWTLEAYGPLMMKFTELVGTENYHLAGVRPEYPGFLRISYFASLEASKRYISSQTHSSIDQDRAKTFGDSFEWLWYGPGYELIKDINKDNESPANTAQVLHLEGFNLSKESEKRYFRWFDRWGYSAFIPLLMKATGLIGFSVYRLVNVHQPMLSSLPHPANIAYPEYLSIFRFTDFSAFGPFEKSTELAVMRGAVEAGFSTAFTLKWYAQYQSMKSLRK